VCEGEGERNEKMKKEVIEINLIHYYDENLPEENVGRKKDERMR